MYLEKLKIKLAVSLLPFFLFGYVFPIFHECERINPLLGAQILSDSQTQETVQNPHIASTTKHENLNTASCHHSENDESVGSEKSRDPSSIGAQQHSHHSCKICSDTEDYQKSGLVFAEFNFHLMSLGKQLRITAPFKSSDRLFALTGKARSPPSHKTRA